MALAATTQISADETQQYVPTYMLEFFSSLPNANKFIFRVLREMPNGPIPFGKTEPDMELRSFDVLIGNVSSGDLIESISIDREEFYRMGEDNLANLGRTTTLVANNFLVKGARIGYTPLAPINVYIKNDRKLSNKDLEKFLPRATEDPKFAQKLADWLNSLRTPFTVGFIISVAAILLYVGKLIGGKLAGFFEFHNEEIQSHGGMDSSGRPDKEVERAEAAQKAIDDAAAGIEPSTPAPVTPKPNFLYDLLYTRHKKSQPTATPEPPSR